MTAERYVYNTDMRERRSISRSAGKKKGGSKSKKCTLPSDAKTAAQKRKMNGPVESVNLNRPMSYEQLKTLNPSLQFLYLDHLVKDCGARRVDIQKMLGCATATLTKVQYNLPQKLVFNPKRRKQSKAWIGFLAGEEEPTAQAEASQPVIAVETPSQVIAEPQPAAAPAIIAGSFTVCCTASALLELLKGFVDQTQAYTFTVSFEK